MNGLPDGDRLAGVAHVVHPKDLNPLGKTGESGGQRAGQSLLRRLAARQLGDERFAADAEHQRAAEAVIERQLIEDFKPLDKVRRRVFQEFLEVRQELIDTLSPEEWDKVFG